MKRGDGRSMSGRIEYRDYLTMVEMRMASPRADLVFRDRHTHSCQIADQSAKPHNIVSGNRENIWDRIDHTTLREPCRLTVFDLQRQKLSASDDALMFAEMMGSRALLASYVRARAVNGRNWPWPA